jgi:hypothetical protein
MVNQGMELPDLITALINSQNDKDSTAFTTCFDENAKVFDEGETYLGREAINIWNEETGKKYDTQNKVLDYKQFDKENILSVNVTGNFAGSPIVLSYHLMIKNKLITNLSITSR